MKHAVCKIAGNGSICALLSNISDFVTNKEDKPLESLVRDYESTKDKELAKATRNCKSALQEKIKIGDTLKGGVFLKQEQPQTSTKPTFHRLGYEEFLIGCEKRLVQKRNERLHQKGFLTFVTRFAKRGLKVTKTKTRLLAF